MPTTHLSNSDDKFFGSIWNDIIFGNDGHDEIYGDWGYDQIYGGKGNDKLDGSLGADLLMGQEGDDFLITSDSAEMHGGTGNDTYRIRFGEGQKPKLIEKAGEGIDTVILFTGNKGAFTLGANFENVHIDTDYVRWVSGATLTLTGNDLANEIRGGAGRNVIDGKGGNDALFGHDDDDVLRGGYGDDALSGRRGEDILHGDSGHDRMDGGSNDDVLHGGDGNDVMFGGSSEYLSPSSAIKGGNDTLFGGAGNDDINGGDGADWMEGGTGNDTYHVDNAKDVVTEAWGQGVDTVKVSLNAYTLGWNVENLEYAGPASKQFVGFGNDLSNKMTLGGGDDFAYGAAGNDTIVANGGHDYVSGGLGDDWVYGGAGDDTLNGDVGDDILYGLAHNDRLNGGGGDDILHGDEGDDVIYGGTGLDRASGGAGADVFLYKSVEDFKKDGLTSTVAAEMIWDFAKGDRIDLSWIDADATKGLNQAFTFLGEAGPMKGQAGVIWTVDTGSTTKVYGDVNGDAQADFRLDVITSLDLSAADFYL